MADKTLSSVLGDVAFKAEVFVFNQEITAAQTGDLVTIGTAGKTTKLTYLTCSGSVAQAGISIDVDGNEVVSANTLAKLRPGALGQFYVSTIGMTNAADGTASGNAQDITGEFITIKKDAGNTTQSLKYSYVTGR